MPRTKKTPARKDGRYEYKSNVGTNMYTGKPIRKSFYSSVSLADAKRKAEEFRLNQAMSTASGSNDNVLSNVSFAVWATKWLNVYKKPNVSENTFRLTYQNCVEKHLIPYFGEYKLGKIKQIDIQNFYAEKSLICSESLMDKLKLCLYGIFETAIDNDIIYKNPAKNATYTSKIEKHEKHIYTDQQIAVAKEYFRDDFPDVCVMLETGIRRGELLGLMWKDIDFDSKTMRIERAIVDKQHGGIDVVPPKWNSFRVIPISTELVKLIKELPHTSEYVLPNSSGNPQSPHTWSTKLRKQMKKMVDNCPNMVELTAHELRHTRGTQLRRNGVDIYTIQRLLGHKDINVTAQVYVHDDTETTRAAAKIV